jgi:hypothetical protein
MIIIILRSLIGMVGGITFFVSLINVWMTWMKGADTSFHWTIAFIGAVMWLQSLPLLFATIKEKMKIAARESRGKD